MTGTLTSMQTRIWAGHRLLSDMPLYNTVWRIDLRTSLDPVLFEAAFAAVTAQCDALRTVIEEVDGAPRMRALSGLAGTFRFDDLGDAVPLDAFVERVSAAPFDISNETCRSTLIRVSDTHFVWVLAQHHIVNDAASGPVIFRALANAYEALRTTSEAPSEPLPSFFDHAAKEHTRPSAADIAHWDEEARANKAEAALYGQRLSGRGTSAIERSVTLTAARQVRIADRADQREFSALTPVQGRRGMLQTVLYAWLARVSRTNAPTVGIATHGRLTPSSRRMAGCLIDVFPLTVQVDPEDTFRGLHRRIRAKALTSLRHAVPGANRGTKTGAVDAVLNAFDLDFGAFDGTQPGVQWLENTHTDPNHPVRLNVIDAPDGAVSLRFLFNQEVFNETTSEHALAHFDHLLEAFLNDPDQRIGQIWLAEDGEQSVALTRTDLADVAEVPDLLAAFAAQVAEDPDTVLILDRDSSLTRAGLNARADAVSEALRALDLGAEALVGVHLRRSAELVATIVGILKAGHAFVPLDPGQAPDRLNAIAEEAQLSAVVSEPALEHNWPQSVHRIDVSKIGPATRPAFDASAGRAAYAIFTSGTTGTPKGVVVGLPALSRYAHWANRVFAKDQTSTWALHSAIGFDLTMTSIFAPLVSGGVIRVYRDPIGTADLSVLTVFEEDACDVVKLTPRHLSLVLQAGQSIDRIRTLVLGGESLSTELARNTKRILGDHVDILNEYGPTEATIGCMLHRFDAKHDLGTAVPIGRPADATRIYVLDQGLNPVPDRVVGDLYIGGIDRLAEGYLRRDAETVNAFLADPFNPGGRMYKSGDLASVGPDGTIRYHGRGDSQMKLGGVRLEPGEIEAAIHAVPGIKDCALSLTSPESLEETFCSQCGISSRTPEAEIGADGVCTLCEEFARVKPEVRSYFREMEDLQALVDDAAARSDGKYDCIMMLSGGKDSTYALCRLAELNSRILCLTLDNGYISDTAKTNITRVTDALGLDHQFLRTPSMNEIFVDSLKRHANVCNGCFKTIYTLGLRRARDERIPLIVTGLSRGQLFETRLTSDLFGETRPRVADIDRMVLEARRSYHMFPDTATKALNGDLFQTGDILSEVEIVDFYRYCDVPVSEIYRYLKSRINWTRPMDTGRSSNCLINDVGIFVHKARRQYHNYALPYSWDVRMGHKTVDEARAELDDELDQTRVAEILDEIGYDEPVGTLNAEQAELVCHYTGDKADLSQLRSTLRQRLPREAIPTHFVHVDKIPLNANGKVDFKSLSAPKPRAAHELAPPNERQGDRESRLLEIFRHYLAVPDLSGGDNFYDFGGTSITALQIAARANAEGMKLNAVDIFTAQSVDRLEGLMDEGKPEPEAPTEAVEVGEKDKARIAALLGKRRSD